MKKILLVTVVLVFSVLVKAQNAIQEFNFNGTLSNTSNTISFSGYAKYVKDRNGVVNGALSITNNVFEASISNLPLSNSRRTVSIWVKYNDVSATNYIWGYGSFKSAQYFGLLQQSTGTSKADLNLAGCGSNNDVIVTTSIASGVWYNYIVTYDGLTSKIYRDGVLIKSSVSPRRLTSAVIFEIGKMGTAVSMNADIDDLKIYDIALSAEEVAVMYDNDSVLASNDEIIMRTGAKGVQKKGDEKFNVKLSTPLEIVNPKVSEIYSSEGLKVLSGDKNVIDITTLPEGTYLLKVSNSQQNENANKLTAN
jgi:hypothetical protein